MDTAKNTTNNPLNQYRPLTYIHKALIYLCQWYGGTRTGSCLHLNNNLLDYGYDYVFFGLRLFAVKVVAVVVAVVKSKALYCKP